MDVVSSSLFFKQLDIACTGTGATLTVNLEGSIIKTSSHVYLKAIYLNSFYSYLDISGYLYITGPGSSGIDLYGKSMIVGEIDIADSVNDFWGINIANTAILDIRNSLRLQQNAFSDGVYTILNVANNSILSVNRVYMYDNPNLTMFVSLDIGSRMVVRAAYSLVGLISVSAKSELFIGILDSASLNNLPLTITYGSTVTLGRGGTATDVPLSISEGSTLILKNNNSYTLPQLPNIITPNGIIYQN